MVHVKNLTTKKGHTAPNQFHISTDSAEVFQSYSTTIAIIKNGNTYININYYDCSRTTMHYLCQFLGTDSILEVRNLLKQNHYKEL